MTIRTTITLPVGCGHNLLSSSSQPKRAHRGDYRMASVTFFGWNPDNLRQAGHQLVEQFPLGSRKPAMVIRRDRLHEIGEHLSLLSVQSAARIEPERYETGLTQAACVAVTYLLTAINAADPGGLTIANGRVVCRVAETSDNTVTIQLLRTIKPVTAKQALTNGQLRFTRPRPGRLVSA